MFAGDFCTSNGANHTVGIDDWQVDFNGRAMVDRRLRFFEDLSDVERAVEQVILVLGAVSADFRSHIGTVKDLAVVEALCLPVIDRAAHFELIDAANHLRDSAEAEFCHQFAQLFSDVSHEVDDCICAALELLTELKVLRGDTDWAGVLVTNTHHQATKGDQWGSCEAELFSAEQAGNCDVATCLELAVCFNPNA